MTWHFLPDVWKSFGCRIPNVWFRMGDDWSERVFGKQFKQSTWFMPSSDSSQFVLFLMADDSSWGCSNLWSEFGIKKNDLLWCFLSSWLNPVSDDLIAIWSGFKPWLWGDVLMTIHLAVHGITKCINSWWLPHSPRFHGKKYCCYNYKETEWSLNTGSGQ